MKKRNLLLSILTAAVIAVLAGAFVACSDVELPEGGKKPTGTNPSGTTYTVTFNAGAGATLVGSATLKTNADGIVQGTVPTASKTGNTFNGWTLTQGGTATINFTTKKFTSNTPVYAVFTPDGNVVPNPTPTPTPSTEYTIRFEAGLNGTIQGKDEVTTVEGIAQFPTPVADPDYEFTFWTDGDGYTVTESTQFTKSTTVTAHFQKKEEQGGDDDDYTFESCDGTSAYLVGKIQAKNQDWTTGWGDGYKFEPFSEGGIDQLIVVVELQAGDEVKIRYGEEGIGYGQIENRAQITACLVETESDENYAIKTTGTYTFKFKPDWETSKIYVVVPNGGNGGNGGDEEVGEDDPDVNANTYYLIGSITQWAVKTDPKYVFTKTKDSDDGKDQYLLSVELKANDVVKIVKGKKTQWISSWEGGWDYADIDTSDSKDNGNLTIKANASYDIYLKVDKENAENTSVWVSKQGGSGEANNDDGGSNFYLFGTMNGQDKWGVDKGGIKFVETELNINEDSPSVIAHKYKVEVDLVARDKVKIFRTGVDNSWDYSYFEAGSLGTNVVVSDTDLTVMTAGHYTFYLREYIDNTVGSNGYTVRVFFVAPAPAATATARINNINIPATTVDTSAAGHATLVKWYKATGVQIEDNTKIKFYVDNKVISVLMRAAKGTIIDGAENMAEEFTVTKGDKFEIHIKYYSDDGWKVWMNGEHDYSQTNPTPNADANAYYLVGTMTGWDINPAATYKLTPKENEHDSRTQYMLTIKLNKDDVVKIVKGDGSQWIGDWQQNWDYGVKDDDSNLVIQQNGTYEFYLKLAKDDMPTEIWVSQQSASGGNQGQTTPSSKVTFTFRLGDNYESNIKDVRIHLFVDSNNSYTTWNTDRDNGVNGGELMTGDGRTFTYTLTLDSKGPVKGIVITFRQDGWNKEQVAKCNDITGNFSGGNSYTFTFDTWTKEVVDGQEKDIVWNGEGYSWDLPFIAKQV